MRRHSQGPEQGGYGLGPDEVPGTTKLEALQPEPTSRQDRSRGRLAQARLQKKSTARLDIGTGRIRRTEAAQPVMRWASEGFIRRDEADPDPAALEPPCSRPTPLPKLHPRQRLSCASCGVQGCTGTCTGCGSMLCDFCISDHYWDRVHDGKCGRIRRSM